MSALLWLVLLAPLLAALPAVLTATVGPTAPRGSAAARRSAAKPAGLGAGAAGLGAGAAGLGLVVTLVLAVDDGARALTWSGPADGPLLGLVADRLAVVLLVLVFSVSGVVQLFAGRYLAADDRAAWFFAATGLLTAASAALATASTLITLALAWTVAGVALCLLLNTYAHLGPARDGTRSALRAFAVGDAALWTAVVVITVAWGSVELRAPDAGRFGERPLLTTGVALLIVVAALSRSAQLPFRRWLPATLAAPTPVSALLHAGVVNAGAILLARTAPVVGSSGWALGVVFTAGALTAAYGTVLMLVKPDVKGSLAHSTMGQMGFMIMTCGLGLYAAAVFHLIAHGIYKATLFLSSGSAIGRLIRHRGAPPVPAPPGPAVFALGALIPALAILAALWLLPADLGTTAAEQALLVFAWASAVAATVAWLRRRPGIGGVLTTGVAALGAALAYVSVVHAVTAYVRPSLVGADPVTGAPWLVGAVAVLLLALGLVRHRVRRLPGLYTLALTASSVPSGARA